MLRSVFVALLFSSSLFAQSAPSLQFRGQRPLHATVTAEPTDLAARNAKLALFINVTPNPDIHVYAPGAKDYIPIAVKLDPQANIKVGKVTYPKSEMMTFADEKVPVFQKPFRLTQEITIVGASLKPGDKVAVTGKVDYQACTDRECYPPESQPISWTITVR